VGIRRVLHGQFMRCPKCEYLFLVSDLVGGATVWHPGCDRQLELVLSTDEFETAVLAMVELSRERNRLEVRPGLGVV
jgi:hypothetical protein